MAGHSEVVVATPGSEGAHGAHAKGGIDTALLGMLLFITSEIMFFAGLFAAYFATRARYGSHWPALPEGVEFHLNILVVIGTITLIASSGVIQWGLWRIRKGDRRGLNRAFAVTMLMGLAFLTLQVTDYTILASEGVTLNGSIFGSLFFTMTGFHGAHVLGGVIGIGVILARGSSGQFSARHHVAVEAVSAYWHFVDVVWVFLFLTLYIVR
ncbi:MAG: cytochrome c oxidase subunit 3 [Candidatus Limnocylindrales bacterium]